MNICEATENAVAEGACMKRKAWPSTWKIQPSNPYLPFEVESAGSDTKKRFWNPTPEDILADDWESI